MTQKVFSERKMANVLKQGQEWTAEFVASQEYKDLSSQAQKHSEIVTVAFSEWMYRAEGRGGKEWTAAAMEKVLTETFPLEVKEYAELVLELSAILTAYFNFLETSQVIKNAGTLLRRLETLDFSSKSVASDGVVAKKVVANQKEKPKKTSQTPAYTAAEIARFNRFSMGTLPKEPVVEVAPKPAVPVDFSQVGRNEACPCGSGKKFKKCHG